MNVHTPPEELDSHKLHCIEVEQALLGALLNYADIRPKVFQILKTEHLCEHLHCRIYEWIKEATAAGEHVDARTAIARFRDDLTIKDLGGANRYMAHLAAEADIPFMATTHANAIKAWAERRKLASLGEDMIELADEYRDKPGDVLAEAVTQLVQASIESETIIRTDVTDKILEAVDKGEASGKAAYAGTDKLHDMLGGWWAGTFCVIAGRPGMGKSTFAPAMFMKAAQQGARVLYFSLEMTEVELRQRLLSCLAYSLYNTIHYADIKKAKLTDQQRERIAQVAPALKALPITIVDKAGLTLSTMRLLAQQEKRLHGHLDVLVIDHIGLVKPEGMYQGNKVAETEAISNALKVMAKDLDCCVVGLGQLNRANEARDDKRPTLSDLRWSGAVEQDADVVIFLYRDAYYIDRKRPKSAADIEAWTEEREAKKNKLEVIVAKNRGDRTATLEMFADMAANFVRDEE